MHCKFESEFGHLYVNKSDFLLFGMFFLIHDFLLISGLKMGIGRGAELKA